jgi:hypothetical protein
MKRLGISRGDLSAFWIDVFVVSIPIALAKCNALIDQFPKLFGFFIRGLTMGLVKGGERILRFGTNSLGSCGNLGFCQVFLGKEEVMKYGHAQNEICNGTVQIFKHCSDLDVRKRRRSICGHAQA